MELRRKEESSVGGGGGERADWVFFLIALYVGGHGKKAFNHTPVERRKIINMVGNQIKPIFFPLKRAFRSRGFFLVRM